MLDISYTLLRDIVAQALVELLFRIWDSQLPQTLYDAILRYLSA